MASKVERNVNALSELCSQSDSLQLNQICAENMRRFDDFSTAFTERGHALSKMIEQSSELKGLKDRRNSFLESLEMVFRSATFMEPPSSRPPVKQ